MEFKMENKAINQSNTTETHGDYVWYYLPIVATVPPLGLPANALVIRHLLGKPGICSTSEIFTLNLALFDMLFCFLVLAEYIYFLCNQTPEAAYFLAWGLNQTGGPLLLSLLSLDSYMGVCRPLVFLRLKDPKLRLSLCLVVLAITATCCGLVKVSRSFKWSVLKVILCSAITIISICSVLILKSLHQSGPGRKEIHPVKRRAFKTVLTAFVLVNFHYLPPLSEYLLKQYFHRYYKVGTSFTYTALSLSSFIQPLSYLVRTKQLPKMRCQRGPTAEVKTVATAARPS